MDQRKLLFAFTLSFSILLEIWVRWVMPITHGQDGFGVWAPVDNVMHFFWGLNIFLFFVLYLKFRPWEALLAVYAWQMLWEAGEMIGDRFLGQPAYMLDHFFLDGIKDTLVDIGGGALGWFLLSRFKGAWKGVHSRPFLKNLFMTHLWLMLPLLPIGLFIWLRSGESPDILTALWILGGVVVALFWTKITSRKESKK